MSKEANPVPSDPPAQDIGSAVTMLLVNGQSLSGRRPRSAHWIARTAELQLAAIQALRLEGLKSGVDGLKPALDGVSGAIRDKELPSQFDVHTRWSDADYHTQERAASALEAIAKFADRSAGGECGAMSTISNRAFVIVAKLTTLTAHLMDLRKVTPITVRNQLGRDEGLIEELVQRLRDAGLHDAVPTLQRATSTEGLDGDEATPAFFADLNRRAALLLGLKCQVATATTQGEAPGEWPPGPGGDDPPPNDIKRTRK